ncbi:MAG: TetR/AcrR family transcriptional regulator [Acidimicrobiales bacterium]
MDHVSLREVSARAGLTHGATYARYEDAEELLVDLWMNNLAERAVALFALCELAAVEPTAANVHAAFDFVRHATEADAAMVHLLLTARRIPVLGEEVQEFLTNYLMREDCRTEGASATFTRALCLFSLLTVQIIFSRHVQRPGHYFDRLEGWMTSAFQTDPDSVPDVELVEPTEPYAMVEPVDLESTLAAATFLVVGKSGYAHATITRIARRANCSPGSIYSLYDSKEELVVAAYNRTLPERWSRIAYFMHFLDQGFLTQRLYLYTHPLNETWRNFLLEFSLASANNSLLYQAHEAQDRGLSTLAPLIPDATDEELVILGHIITVLSLLTYGIAFLATTTGSLECTNYSQFAEPFRRSILNEVGTTWVQLCERVDQMVEERNR